MRVTEFFTGQTGTLLERGEWQQGEDGTERFALSGVEWLGSPITVISQEDVADLPEWAKTDLLIQIGPFVLRRTEVFNPSLNGYYWYLVGGGEWYWLRWQLHALLEEIVRKVRMTLAIWALRVRRDK